MSARSNSASSAGSALSLLTGGFERNPLRAYVPYPKQAQFHAAPERLRGFYGANRVGKTHCGCADDLIQLLPPALVPEHLLPYKRCGFDVPARGRVITGGLSHTTEAVLDKFRELTPPEALRGGGFDSAFDKAKQILHFARGDRVDFMSFDQKPELFGGVRLNFAHYDEEPSGTNSKRIRRDTRIRLTDLGGYEIFTMTPFSGVSWVFDLLWERQDEPGTFVVRAAMKDNPYIDPEEIERLRNELAEEEFQIAVLGMPVTLEGKFYKEFTRELHVRSAPTPKDVKGWDVIVGLDPGLNRTGIVWVGFDGDNAAFVFDELYPSNQVPMDIVPQIETVNSNWQITPDYYVIDPSSRVRSQIDYEQVQSEYQRLGINCIPGQNARGPGIMQVKRRLQHEGLYVSEECTNLIWEFPRYRKDPKSDDEFKARKEDDHLLDGLRYVCMERPWVAAALYSPQTDDFSSWEPGTAPPAEWLDQARPEPSPSLGSMM